MNEMDFNDVRGAGLLSLTSYNFLNILRIVI